MTTNYTLTAKDPKQRDFKDTVGFEGKTLFWTIADPQNRVPACRPTKCGLPDPKLGVDTLGVDTLGV